MKIRYTAKRSDDLEVKAAWAAMGWPDVVVETPRYQYELSPTYYVSLSDDITVCLWRHFGPNGSLSPLWDWNVRICIKNGGDPIQLRALEEHSSCVRALQDALDRAGLAVDVLTTQALKLQSDLRPPFSSNL